MRPAAFLVTNPTINFSAVIRDEATATDKAAAVHGTATRLYSPLQMAAYIRQLVEAGELAQDAEVCAQAMEDL